MTPAGQNKKIVAVFDPEERSRSVIVPMLEGLGYEVDLHHTSQKLISRLSGKQRADAVFLHLAAFGETYQQVTDSLAACDLAVVKNTPPILAVTILKLSQDARTRLEQLGCSVLLSRHAPLMEVMFSINRLLFPKFRELRKYTRVFGGFPVRFSSGQDWQDGQIYNLSREGAFVQCDKPPAEHARIQVRFVLPRVDVPFQVDTVVSWVNGADRDNDPLSPPGMGISFLALNSEAANSLGKFINTREPHLSD